MDNIGLKKKYFSLKMDNITVITLKALAKQHGIKGYYKLRNAEQREIEIYTLAYGHTNIKKLNKK